MGSIIFLSSHMFLVASYSIEGKDYHHDCEVGLLTRNIVIEGAPYPKQMEQSFGGRVLLGHFSSQDRDYTGKSPLLRPYTIKFRCVDRNSDSTV